ncbi:MAG TPA: MFS transporter [Halococcus sp.]|nr:MFS transporter [Halococcus sp.]
MRENGQRNAIALGAAANKTATILMGTVMAIYIGRNGGSPLAVGLVYSVYWAGLMLFAPVWGAVADATGRRRAVLAVTAVFATAATAPLVFSHGIERMVGFRGLYAVFAAGFLPVMLTIVNQRGGESTRGRALGFFNSATAVGLMAGQFFSGVLIDFFRPDRVFLVIAGTSVLVVVSVAGIRDSTAEYHHEVSLSTLLGEVRNRLYPLTGDTEYLRRNGLQWLYVAVFLRNLTVLGISGVLPVYLVSKVGVSTFLMGVLLAINPVAQVAFMYVLGRISDHIGRKPLIVVGAISSGVYATVLAVATVPSSLAGRVVVATVGFLLLAGGFSALMTGTIAFIGDIAPVEHESELIGLRQTARGLGGAVGPVVLGTLATVAGYSVAFAVGGLLSLAAAVAVASHLVESHTGTELRKRVVDLD